MALYLYLLSQEEKEGWDTYDSCVVAAENEEEAKKIHPDGGDPYRDPWKWDTWATSPDNVRCEYLGVATETVEKGLIIASFNAG